MNRARQPLVVVRRHRNQHYEFQALVFLQKEIVSPWCYPVTTLTLHLGNVGNTCQKSQAGAVSKQRDFSRKFQMLYILSYMQFIFGKRSPSPGHILCKKNYHRQ